MFAPLAALIAVFILWSAYWYVANSAAQKYAGLYRSQLNDRGFSLVCGSESWGGYPFRFEFTCADPTIKFPGGATARSGAVLAVAQAYNPTHVIALIDGPTEITSPDSAPRTLTHGQAVISVVARSEGIPRIAAQIPDFNGSGVFLADGIQIHTRPADNGGNDIAITVEGASYNEPGKPALAIDHAQLLATLAANYKLAIGDLQFNQGELKLWGQGAVELDAENRIEGRITAQTNDLGRLLAVLDPHIEMEEQDRATLKAILGLLGKEAKADLVARDGEFFIGPIKAGELRPLY